MWTNDYVSVWHLNEIGATSSDSTSTGNYLTPVGGVAQNPSGIIAGAGEFNGLDSYLYKDYDASDGLHPTAGPYTLSAWFKTSVSTPVEQTVLSTHYAGVGRGYMLLVEQPSYAGKLVGFAYSGTGDVPPIEA
ncbi:hypothetical protein ACFL5C_03020 [Candidatus Omnitrophota bacterium]